jgi:uncharacterized protein (DUF2267 family)
MVTATTGLGAFDVSIQNSTTWFEEFMDELGWHDKYKGYLALRAALQSMRDRLPPEKAALIGSELPMVIRGLYYEGWTPAGKPVRPLSRIEYLNALHEYFNNEPSVDPERIVRGMFRLINKSLQENGIRDIERILPGELKEFWP